MSNAADDSVLLYDADGRLVRRIDQRQLLKTSTPHSDETARDATAAAADNDDDDDKSRSKLASFRNVYKALPVADFGSAGTIFTARCYASAVLAMAQCLSVCLSVCPSVCLSVTSRCSTKTAKRRITQTTPHDSPGTLAF